MQHIIIDLYQWIIELIRDVIHQPNILIFLVEKCSIPLLWSKQFNMFIPKLPELSGILYNYVTNKNSKYLDYVKIILTVSFN
jgi:hypothetical protein